MLEHSSQIGFMQGRMSPLVDGKIQCFPTDHWEQEFLFAERAGFSLMEWTIDADGFYENPLISMSGRQAINELSTKHGVRIESVTGDCLMQSPFFKKSGAAREESESMLLSLIDASGLLGCQHIVFPLVDEGSIKSEEQEESLIDALTECSYTLRKNNVSIVFESDYAPKRLKAFIDKLPRDCFGINLDIGNSAALGFLIEDEIASYGARIKGVHIKDRIFGGGTVPLGEGDADIRKSLRLLIENNYKGNFILQTARAIDDDHVGVLKKYRAQVSQMLN